MLCNSSDNRRGIFCVVLATVSAQWRPGVRAGILKLMKITLGDLLLSSRRPPESQLTLNGRNIPFVNTVKYLGVIFDKKVT
jgi:hypothetical protein